MTDLAYWRWGTGRPRAARVHFTPAERARLRFVRWLVARGRLSEQMAPAGTPSLSPDASAEAASAR
jgi:hypothetical protein